MMRFGKTLALALIALALGSSVWALTSDTPGGPYHGIVERNVFDVHPAPLVPLIAPPPPGPPPPSIRLQGITDILGRRQVLFKVQLPPKAGAPAKDESFILTVGERQGEIEVLEIDPKAGTVRMKNYGVETNLSLEMNSDKLVNTAPVAAPPPPPTPGNPMTAPGALAPPPSLPVGKFPRTLRLPTSPGIQNNSSQSGGANYRGGIQNQNDPNTHPDFDRQLIGIEAQRLIYKEQGNPLAETLPPIPPGIRKAMGLPPEPVEAPQ